MAVRLVSEVIVTLLLFSVTVRSKKPPVDCFVCGWSPNDGPCGDAAFALTPEQNHHYMVNCSVCYKKIKVGSSGEKLSILRGCSLNDWVYLSKCQSIDYEGGFSEQVCACRENYCNNAPPTIGGGGGANAFCILAVSVALAVMRLRV